MADTPRIPDKLSEIVKGGDYHASLLALRDYLARTLEQSGGGPGSAALAKLLADVLKELAMTPAAKGSKIDELTKRRAARRSAAATE